MESIKACNELITSKLWKARFELPVGIRSQLQWVLVRKAQFNFSGKGLMAVFIEHVALQRNAEGLGGQHVKVQLCTFQCLVGATGINISLRIDGKVKVEGCRVYRFAQVYWF